MNGILSSNLLRSKEALSKKLKEQSTAEEDIKGISIVVEQEFTQKDRHSQFKEYIERQL